MPLDKKTKGKDAFYFRHDANASQDMKLKHARWYYQDLVEKIIEEGKVEENKDLVLSLVAWGTIGWYWYIIECLRSEDEYRLEYSEHAFRSFSEDMKCKRQDIQDFIDHCINDFTYKKKGLLTLEDGYFFSDRLNRDMEAKDERKEKARESGRLGAEVRLQKLKERVAGFEVEE